MPVYAYKLYTITSYPLTVTLIHVILYSLCSHPTPIHAEWLYKTVPCVKPISNVYVPKLAVQWTPLIASPSESPRSIPRSTDWVSSSSFFVFFLSPYTRMLWCETGGSDSDNAEVPRLLGHYTVPTGKLTDVSDKRSDVIFKVQQLFDPGEEDTVILGKVGSYLSTNLA